MAGKRRRKEEREGEEEEKKRKEKEIHSIVVNFNLQQVPAATQCESCNVAQSL